MESSTKKIGKGLVKASIVVLVLAVLAYVVSINWLIPFLSGTDVTSGGSNTWGWTTGLWAYKNYFAFAIIGEYGKTYYANTCNMEAVTLVTMTVASVVLLVTLAIVVGKNKGKVVSNIIVGILATFLAGYAYATAAYGVGIKMITDRGRFACSLITALAVAAAALNLVAMIVKLIDAIVPNIVKDAGYATKDDVKEAVEEKPVEEKKEEPVEEKKEEPVKEEPAPVEEKKEEPVVAPAPVAEEPAVPGYAKNNRRKASFETKVKKSEEDLRHKYYDLRDYIRSYGIGDRISIPGHTFSAHRERYAFITITGKHIKVNLALDPKTLEGGTVPFTVNESKKFEDLPVTIKIRSDLSYRRALKLVDDVMAAKGVQKPEGK
ncbi:MAG: hypothetical protein MJ239_03775 [Bacilli bacterium]|nr:hypothetical protein [Bacilli bacterium]